MRIGSARAHLLVSACLGGRTVVVVVVDVLGCHFACVALVDGLVVGCSVRIARGGPSEVELQDGRPARARNRRGGDQGRTDVSTARGAAHPHNVSSTILYARLLCARRFDDVQWWEGGRRGGRGGLHRATVAAAGSGRLGQPGTDACDDDHVHPGAVAQGTQQY